MTPLIPGSSKGNESPESSHPIVWRLFTNRQVVTEEQAAEIIDWYRCRWEIEMFFDVLKVSTQY